MREDVRRALAIDRSSSLSERTIDITTTGRRTGQPRRIEICFVRVDDQVYISGVPRPRARDWLVNLTAEPNFVFHLKNGVTADLRAVATVITDPAERTRVLTDVVDSFNYRWTPDVPFPRGIVDDWVQHSPLVSVDFPDSD